MKNLLSFASKLAATMPLAVFAVYFISTSANAQVDTSASAQGNQNNTNNMLTGSQAMQSYGNRGNTWVGRAGSYGLGLNPTSYSTQAARSGMNHSFSSGGLNYGFQGTGFNNTSASGGQHLPTTSTGSVDLNIVENTNYQLYGGSGGIPINTIPILNTLTTAAEAVNNAAASAAQIQSGLNESFNGPGN